MDAQALVAERVREGVRSRGIDPLLEPDAVRALADEAVAEVLSEVRVDHPRGDTADRLARGAFDAVAGFGPLQRLFDDPEIEEVWISERLSAGWSRPRRSVVAVKRVAAGVLASRGRAG